MTLIFVNPQLKPLSCSGFAIFRVQWSTKVLRHQIFDFVFQHFHEHISEEHDKKPNLKFSVHNPPNFGIFNQQDPSFIS